MSEGESKQYSADGKFIYLTAKNGIEIFANNQPVTINGATTVTINAANEIIANTPILKCSGDILDNFETNNHTVAQMRAIFNSHNHAVNEVESGGSTVISNSPNATQ